MSLFLLAPDLDEGPHRGPLEQRTGVLGSESNAAVGADRVDASGLEERRHRHHVPLVDGLAVHREEHGVVHRYAVGAAGIQSMLSEDPEMTREDVLFELKKLTKDFNTDKKDKVSSKKIKGANVNEILSMQEVKQKSRSQFTGYTIKEKTGYKPSEM